jgi:hypothetical protein
MPQVARYANHLELSSCLGPFATLFCSLCCVYFRYVVKDGQVLLQAAALPQLVEQMLDENFKGTRLHARTILQGTRMNLACGGCVQQRPE